MAITLPHVLELYQRFGPDLQHVRDRMRALHRRRCGPRRVRSVLHSAIARLPLGIGVRRTDGRGPQMLAQLDDEVCEILYLLLRSRRPATVVEISPCHGWSTCWILSALRDNDHGTLYSFDVLDAARDFVPADLRQAGLQQQRWHLVVGDVRDRTASIPPRIDFLFMDSDHSAGFAQWYLEAVLPRLRAGSVVCVDDVFHSADPGAFDGEGRVVVDWLADRAIEYFTCARAKNPSALNSIHAQKLRMGLSRRIRNGDGNTTIMFET